MRNVMPKKAMCGKSKGLHHAIDVSGGALHAAGGPPLAAGPSGPGKTGKFTDSDSPTAIGAVASGTVPCVSS